MFRWKRLAAVVAVAALGLTGCASTGGDNGSTSQTLTLGVIVPATTFSAADLAWANESPYGQAVYDTILKADPDGKIIPSLATEWSYNDDNTVLTLTLRDDVTFTDGTTLDADAVAQNLIRFRDGASPNKSFLADIADATATDATTVEITLAQANPALLTYLTQNAGTVESPAAFGNSDIQTVPVGSGPYVLDVDKTVVGTSYAFSRNADYWDTASYPYDELTINVYSDPTAMLNAIKGGQVNATKVVNNNDIGEIEAAGFTINSFELDWQGLILFDRAGTMNEALGKLEVRQALNYAFDTEALLQAVGQGYGTPTTQVFPETSVAYDPALDSRYSYDPAKAKQLLADAGYPNGFTLDMPSTTFMGTTLFPLIEQQLKDVGITAKFTDPGNNFIADMLAPKWAASWMVLQQDPDWALINFKIAPNSTFNPFKYEDPKVDVLIAKIQQGDDAAAKDLNAYIVEQAWFAPWYRQSSPYVTDADTTVKTQAGNAYPYLWNIQPK